MRRKAKSPLAKAKEKAWKQFSTYIRTRDCLETTKGLREGVCCTCQRRYPFEALQAGHFIDGRNNAVLFSEQGVHAQCSGCNLFLHGNKLKYWVFMENKYGREVIDELIRESHTTIKRRAFDYDDLCLQFQEKTEALLAQLKA